MPWLSDKQRAWGHTPEGEQALGGKAKVHEWDEAARGKWLPERAPKKSSPKSPLKHG